MKRRQTTHDEMLLRMAGLCAGAEQCSADIRQKILRQGFSTQEAERMVEYLVANKYIDDARYARAYASDKIRFSGWGKMKVRMGLRVKHIPEAVAEDALAAIPAKDYTEALRKALVSKARNLDLEDVRGRQKLYRYLASRGFESEAIISAIRIHIRRNNSDVE